MERTRHIPCPSNNEGCKYAPNCHTSEHHIYPRRTAETRLQRAFGNLAINKVISCRMIHDVLDTFPPPEYPDVDTMKQTVKENRGREWHE